MNNPLCPFKIELNEITPAIWRRFFVPADLTLETLHTIIQIVMGWENYHLYEFVISGKCYIPESENTKDLEPSHHQLISLDLKKGQSFSYVYDFGDNWRHTITLENDTYKPDRRTTRLIKCLEGAEACPPEDCGGPLGYMDFYEAMIAPKNKHHFEVREWHLEQVGISFDGNKFDQKQINRQLQKIRVYQ
ncbi:plasmid pRiA4b ORF-3 family protein [Oxalobacter vibrioformis]|uniref:Plasmid pRiA4b ORF-3 family protein n=1 Tax=Oxalobacter vibrioformis TaxID=933080 RepID=A0A9E9M032_9BURK|nr:plasmid pRiA4b ORF-3 family protein [Oxalobacter vibrioformis]WAW10383.1 plasmid pRiA4b ORF-3 family protein [Oxalobacter vibrioformis]